MTIIALLYFILGILFALFIISLANPIVDVLSSGLEYLCSKNAVKIAKNNIEIEKMTQKQQINPIAGFKENK